jgi:hypothetical protein
MPYKKEEDDDLFEDDFEFVDDEDDDEEDSELDEEDEDEEDSEIDGEDEEAPPAKPKRGVRKAAAAAEPDAAPKGRSKPAPRGRGKSPAEKTTPAPPADEEEVDEEEEVPQPEMAAEPVGPPADHVVHVYEFRKFKRTIARDFTSDDADKFAAEYNRTSATHSRWAVSGNKSDQPTSKI